MKRKLALIIFCLMMFLGVLLWYKTFMNKGVEAIEKLREEAREEAKIVKEEIIKGIRVIGTKEYSNNNGTIVGEIDGNRIVIKIGYLYAVNSSDTVNTLKEFDKVVTGDIIDVKEYTRQDGNKEYEIKDIVNIRKTE